MTSHGQEAAEPPQETYAVPASVTDFGIGDRSLSEVTSSALTEQRTLIEVYLVSPPQSREERLGEISHVRVGVWLQMLKKLSIWSFFGVTLALIPIISNGVTQAFSGGYSFEGVLEKGDLFIVSAIISGSAVGILLEVKKNRWLFHRSLASSACFILSILNSICYGPAANASKLHYSTVFHLSLALFLAALITSGVGMALAVEE